MKQLYIVKITDNISKEVEYLYSTNSFDIGYSQILREEMKLHDFYGYCLNDLLLQDYIYVDGKYVNIDVKELFNQK